VSQNHKMAIARVLGIVMLWIFTLLPVNSIAQDDKAAPDKLLVGVVDAPPFATRGRPMIRNYVKVDDLVDRVIEGLRKAGLADLK